MNSKQKRTDMLEMVTEGARVMEDNIKRGFTSPMGIFTYAAGSGLLGVLILMAFFSMLLPVPVLFKLLPVFIAFNAAASAYGIVDKGGAGFPRLTLSLITLSALYVATQCLLITILLPWEPVVIGVHLLIGSLTALSFSFLGARLAKKTLENIKKSQS